VAFDKDADLFIRNRDIGKLKRERTELEDCCHIDCRLNVGIFENVYKSTGL
jgi:hypothetical protein